jgi:hypothetical protein
MLGNEEQWETNYKKLTVHNSTSKELKKGRKLLEILKFTTSHLWCEETYFFSDVSWNIRPKCRFGAIERMRNTIALGLYRKISQICVHKLGNRCFLTTGSKVANYHKWCCNLPMSLTYDATYVYVLRIWNYNSYSIITIILFNLNSPTFNFSLLTHFQFLFSC